VGKIEQLQVPRDRQGEVLTEVFERYQQMTGDVEEAVLEMYLQGVPSRKVSQVTQALSKVKVGQDAVSRIAAKLEDGLRTWRCQRRLKRGPVTTVQKRPTSGHSCRVITSFR
jgi:transposase-like protein